MTMAVGFILGDNVYLAADKRLTYLNNDGSDKSYSDSECKVFPLSCNAFVFAGGIVQATQPLKRRIIQEFSGKELNEKDFEKIGELCREEYDVFMQKVSDELKASSWLKDFVLSLIIADNIDEPKIVGYDIKNNFKPVIRSNQGTIYVKSAIEPNILWSEIQRIIETEDKKSFNPVSFIDKIFLSASEMNRSISAKHDLFIVPRLTTRLTTLNSLAFQKLTAGTITAKIAIQSPTIMGGTITGAVISNTGPYTQTCIDSTGITFRDINNCKKLSLFVEYDNNANLEFRNNIGKTATLWMSDSAFGLSLVGVPFSVSGAMLVNGSLFVQNNAVATQPWVSSNFAATGHTHDSLYYTKTETDDRYALTGHNHGNSYLKSAANQNISCQLYGGYLEVFQDGSYVGRVQLTT